ncbi:MAG: hypothetical protein QXT45_06005 [Candidatus Bilamarchaeaceae archaeon]
MKKVKSSERIYLTCLESGKRIIPLELIRSWKLAKDSSLNVIMHRLCKEKKLLRIKRGLFYVLRPGEEHIDNIYEVALAIYPGYLGFSTALELRGLMDEMSFTIYVITSHTRGRRQMGEYEIKAVPLGRRAFGFERLGDYNVSTVAKTIYDCLKKPGFAGGYPKVLRAVYYAEMKNEDWEELLYYLEKFEKGSFLRKTGYLVELLKKETGKRIPDWVFRRLRKKKGGKAWLGRGKGTHNRRWNVMDCMGKSALLSWWYHG